LTFKIVFI